ncbi:uncharacterized protein SAPINGB_P000091 [Magnusiomyces paraingens]|uniref:Uncharacterized protein n=1 Tax=Magnusiomyces paraingens TaxID=2606893 RepID=A0A5E8B459_9ASCO|nr:uncharacterized protein SAPINGB_P000091 [Saprochaete ingens]VVT43670.1 unnamed protein product [Saprochaete ingens]
MSYYPADQGLLNQHNLFDSPEEKMPSFLNRLSGNTSQTLDILSSALIISAWALALYCIIKSLYLFSVWSFQNLRIAIKNQQDKYDGTIDYDNEKLASPFSFIPSSRKYKQDDDLESQTTTSSSMTSPNSVPSLSHTPDLASPTSSYSALSSPTNSPQYMVSTTLPPHSSESFQRIKSSSFTIDHAYPPPKSLDSAPKKYSNTTINVLDSYDSQLMSSLEHPMIKTH